MLYPSNELRFVEGTLANVEVTHFLVLGFARRERAQRGAAEERHFDVFREAVKAEEPALLVLGAVTRRIPFHGLANAGDGTPDKRFKGNKDPKKK